ncbi:hypothetical protein SK128_021572 [Halocaridina rubra]|uniref:DUF4706 domain-containing protein n=1 Tax=Halocaridina rubra TaxID=373956 RepID=A0AAN8WS26_HALRR
MPAPSSVRSTSVPPSEVSPPEEYFRGVSTLCRRMLDDMSAVKESFGEKWDQLSYTQQCRVIDQAIVDEATVRRYESGVTAGPECEYFPKLKLPTGQKVVCDENLTARGFSCSWRDEHSAPFSWHTRSQMDLTLDTPPDTPTHPGTPTEPPPTSIEGQGRVIPGGRAVYTARPISLPRPPRFRWHYDPPDGPPESPSVVVAAPRFATLPTDLSKGPQRSSPVGKYMLVRGKGNENDGGTLLAKIRGAVAALTATCLPLRTATFGATSHLTVHSATAEGGEPELRPAHVKAQADKYLTGSKSSYSSQYKNYQAPFSNITADSTLSSYMCSLPDEEDDVPYTAVHADTSSYMAPPCQLPPTSLTSTVNVEHIPDIRGKTTTTMSSHKHVPNDDLQIKDYGSANFMSPTAILPTPVPTPTTGDLDNTLSTFTPKCASTPGASQHVHNYSSNRLSLPQPDLISDTMDSRAEINIPANEKLLQDKGKSKDENVDLATPVLSRKSEVIIPKTGFDFLDNW